MEFVRRHKIALIIIGLLLFFAWVELEQRFVIKGRVVDASTNKPIEGASVAIRWTGTHITAVFVPYASGTYEIEEADAITDKDGYFEIPKYFLKSFEMGVYKKGYVCWSNDSIFTKGLDLEKRNQIKKRIWFWAKPYMKIKLEPFTEEYPRFEHASFLELVSGSSGGLKGAGEEIAYFYKIYKQKDRKNITSH